VFAADSASPLQKAMPTARRDAATNLAIRRALAAAASDCGKPAATRRGRRSVLHARAFPGVTSRACFVTGRIRLRTRAGGTMSDRQVAIGIWKGGYHLRQSSRRRGRPPGFPWWPDMRTGCSGGTRLGVRESASVRVRSERVRLCTTRLAAVAFLTEVHALWAWVGLGVAAALCKPNACRRRACAPAAGTTCGSRRSGVRSAGK